MCEHLFELRLACALKGDDFDFGVFLDTLRCHSTEWLEEQHVAVTQARQCLATLGLGLVKVLDERGRVDDSLAAATGTSVRSVRETVDTARALEELPELAAAAFAGRVSAEQLAPAARLADPSSDGEWAERAANTSPSELQRQVRAQQAPTVEAMVARHARRRFRWWDRADDPATVATYGEFPDIEGVLVKQVFEHMIERMRPAKGQQWSSRDQRGADALVELCRNYADVHAVEFPTPLLVVEVPMEGPATIAGIPLPEGMVESLRASARVEPVLVDHTGDIIAAGTVTSTLSAKIRRAVLRRDARCRWPGCERRSGLEVHHLWPASWGGGNEIVNLAAVCVGGSTDHHRQLAPQGGFLLVGNPNQPHGLHLVDRDELTQTRDASRRVRAGPAPG